MRAQHGAAGVSEVSVNYGDLECSPWAIARQESAADAALDAGYCERCQRELELADCGCEGDPFSRFEAAAWAQEMRDLDD